MACKCGNIDRVKKLYQQKLAKDRAAAEAKAEETKEAVKTEEASKAEVEVPKPRAKKTKKTEE